MFDRAQFVTNLLSSGYFSASEYSSAQLDALFAPGEFVGNEFNGYKTWKYVEGAKEYTIHRDGKIWVTWSWK